MATATTDDTQTILCAIPRCDKNGDATTELRIALATYRGHPFVDVRQWQLAEGKWRATKKGTSVKAHELLRFQQAINEAVRLLESPDDSQQETDRAEPSQN